jgi:hypothetical protein
MPCRLMNYLRERKGRAFSWRANEKAQPEAAVPKCFLNPLIAAAEAWVAAFPLVAQQALALLPAAAMLEAALPQVAAWFAAAPEMFLAAAGQALIPATSLRQAKSRLLLCVRAQWPPWSECAADRFP